MNSMPANRIGFVSSGQLCRLFLMNVSAATSPCSGGKRANSCLRSRQCGGDHHTRADRLFHFRSDRGNGAIGAEFFCARNIDVRRSASDAGLSSCPLKFSYCCKPATGKEPASKPDNSTVQQQERTKKAGNNGIEMGFCGSAIFEGQMMRKVADCGINLTRVRRAYCARR
jgi:hypothetical protein